MAKKKFYVVWQGRKTGVFSNWDQCKAQISEFPNAKYKSFESLQQAEEAYTKSSDGYIGKNAKQVPVVNTERLKLVGRPIIESISVDGAWNTATGKIEYQGVYTKTNQIIFHQGPFDDGTNNIAEFLAIVHALAYCKTKDIYVPIYSDSRNAIGWVAGKKAKTNHAKSSQNIKLFELIDRAEKWLHTNTYSNKILKWETKAWGENPADFGRK
jgi:ribonuclease HI